LDLIGDMAFGLPMGFLDNGEDSKDAQTMDGQVYRVPGTIDALHRGVRFGVAVSQLPSHTLIKAIKIAVNAVPGLAKRLGSVGAVDFQNICVHQLRRRINHGPPPRPSNDFMDFVLSPNEQQQNDPDARIGKILADSNMMMNAGSDTTAAALSSTIYHLLSNPTCLAKLRGEIEEIIPFHTDESAEEALLPYASVCGLPYLRACIDETLRLRPPIAYQLPRLVHAPDGAMIAGHHIQKGTVVAVPTYSVHRHEGLYKEPDAFKPERWLDTSDPDQIQSLKSYIIPFSQGSRACIGRHIAIVELQILISTFVRRYDMALISPVQQLPIFERFNSNPGPLPIHLMLRGS
jgi:benzoate 4-monooxygenase